MIHGLPNENIIKKKKCEISGEDFLVKKADIDFYNTVSPIFNGKKYSIPAPTLHPTERMRRRLAFRNEGSLYIRKCDLSKKQIVSMFPSETSYTVYDKDVWYSDDWDPYTYGCKFDNNKNFFEQFGELFLQVPRMARIQQSGMENSDFCNCAANCKDCYLCFSTNKSEKCMYGTFNLECYECYDSYNITKCENCYDCMDIHQCHSCICVRSSSECRDCLFCWNCIGCSDCLFCTNLRQKQYCIMNQQYTKEEYNKKKDELNLDTYAGYMKAYNSYKKLLEKTGVKYMYGVQNEESSGNIIDHCTSADTCFECNHIEHGSYLNNIVESKDCMDYSYWGVNCDHIYETMACGFNCSNILFSNHVWENCSNIILSESCMYSKNLFACDGLRKAENCIFNTPYGKLEYEKLCGEIIDHMKSTGEWGEFFPVHMSEFGYNETVAQDYFPLEETHAKERGYKWNQKNETQSYHGSHHTPLSIDQYDEKVTNKEEAQKNIKDCTSQIHVCSQTGGPFKVLPQELAFYIQNSLPVPTLAPDIRHKVRMESRNKRSLHSHNCDTCGLQLETSYQKEKVGKILCESCYNSLNN